jgi:hypothetical protein
MDSFVHQRDFATPFGPLVRDVCISSKVLREYHIREVEPSRTPMSSFDESPYPIRLKHWP